ncbi:MAG: response regulator [Clostridiales bacterium]|jgi:two-component system response regulator YesN|nr:response regulator [Clostridiales bacterium]
MKVLIADDEINICKLIKNSLDWEGLGLELCAMETNGPAVLESIKKYSPEIVITDIQMPGMSGIDIIAEVSSWNTVTRFIIISGYSYFEYAQKAVQYGVENFLLKPIRKCELNDTVARLAEKIEKGRQLRTKISKQTSELKQSKSKVRRSFLLSNLDAERVFKNAQELNNEFYFNFSYEYFTVGIVHIAHTADDANTDIVLNNFRSSLKNNLSQIGAECEIEAETAGKLCFILNHDSTDAVVERTLSYCVDDLLASRSLIKPNFITVGISDAFTLPSSFKQAYQNANNAVACRFFPGKSRVLRYAPKESAPSEKTWQFYLDELQEKLTAVTDKMQFDAIPQLVAQAMGKMCPALSRTPVDTLRAFESLTAILTRFSDNHEDEEKYNLLASRANNYAELTAIAEVLASSAQSKLNSRVLGRNAAIVEKVKKYLKENLCNAVDLSSAAREVNFAPSYLGVIFKAETGIGFSDYLMRLRMDTAKELLSGLRDNVSQVANKVGYRDVKHFSGMFRRIVGITPAEYRKIHHLKEAD